MKDLGGRKVIEGRRLSPHRWMGARSIGMAHQLNDQVIECCCELSSDVASSNLIPPVTAHRDLWRGLDPESRKRLAQFPFVIVDLRFGDLAWWRVAIGNSTNPRNRPISATPAARWDWLALETLMFGWQVAREDRIVASTLFAMPLAVADCIAALTMQQVRTLAVESAQYLRLRWDNHPYLWRELLNASRERDETQLEAIRRLAKLYFCGELIQTSAKGVPMPLILGDEIGAAESHRS